MSKPRDPQRLAEIEYCISRYFNSNILPIMKSEKESLQRAQAKEFHDNSQSFAAMSRSAVNARHGLPDDSLLFVRFGKECGKTSEDYVETCLQKISENDAIQKDFQRLAGEWRTAIVKEIGRERYDELSEKLGTDLAFAYLENRIEQQMIDRMVADKMPKSSFDYILHKGMSESLFGIGYEMLKSPLDHEIDERCEAAYKPTKGERLAVKGVSLTADAVTLGGVYSWGSLAKLAGTEIIFSGLEKIFDKEVPKGMSVDEVLSQAIFGDENNYFPSIRKNSAEIVEYENTYLREVESTLSRKMNILTEKPEYEDLFKTDPDLWQKNNPFDLNSDYWKNQPFSFQREVPLVIAPGQEQVYLDWKAEQEGKGKGNYKPQSTSNTSSSQNQSTSNTLRPDVPLVIAPGKEQEYLDWLEENNKKKDMAENQTIQNKQEAQDVQEANQTVPQTDSQSPQTEQPEDNNNLGWSNLFSSVGLDGFGDITRNLPFVISMLPDMLVGLLTGKTESVGLKKDIIPVASILLGMFIKNPLLKMVLIGMGGANLLNKMGHEAIGRQQPDVIVTQQFKQYADEPLNPRIVNPVLKGNTLIATIDNVPCSITIPENAARAYEAGALPLNTLVNAILARNDNMREMAARNYQEMDMRTIERDRGIGIK
ncbi:MAG: hypothetical protein J1F38_04600 [Muribaculaceae bacterium]|nr:hypothetical protein [Muribaculaceae bacterium]